MTKKITVTAENRGRNSPGFVIMIAKIASLCNKGQSWTYLRAAVGDVPWIVLLWCIWLILEGSGPNNQSVTSSNGSVLAIFRLRLALWGFFLPVYLLPSFIINLKLLKMQKRAIWLHLREKFFYCIKCIFSWNISAPVPTSKMSCRHSLAFILHLLVWQSKSINLYHSEGMVKEH